MVRTLSSSAEVVGSIPAQGAKIPHGSRLNKKTLRMICINNMFKKKKKKELLWVLDCQGRSVLHKVGCVTLLCLPGYLKETEKAGKEYVFFKKVYISLHG